MARWEWWARLGLPTVMALLFWLANAVLLGRRLAEPDMVRGFFWNMLLFAVVITSINSAIVAWTSRRPRGDEAGAAEKAQGKLALGSVLTAFAAALVGLACGMGVTSAVVASHADSGLWSLFSKGLGVALPLGVMFALVGAVAGDLGANLRALLAEKSAPKLAPGLLVLLVVAHLLWAGVAWVALASARGHMPGA